MNPHNLVSITGRLTADPELRQTTSGVANCRISVAVNRPYQKDKEQTADFINVQAWKHTAEFICRYFKKGTPITVIGSMRNNNYTDQSGVKHYGMDVQAENVSFVPKHTGDSSASSGVQQSVVSALKTADEPVELGDLGDFEEILSDGEVPF